MATVLITGVRGFIGSSLAPVLQSAGMRVVGASRQGGTLPGCDAVYAASLGDSLVPLFEREPVDAVVHCALDSGPDAYRTNVDGATRWLEEARAAGARVQILLSSLSADAGALSDYGRAKHALEERFTAAGQVVFRLAIVVGDGGMFRRLVTSVRRFPIVPLLGGGRQPVYVLGIDFLCRALRDAISGSAGELGGRTWNLQQPEGFPLRRVLEVIAAQYGWRRLFLPIPVRPVLLVLRTLERLPFVALPITSTNVQGLAQSTDSQVRSDYARFGYPEQELDVLVAAVARREGSARRVQT